MISKADLRRIAQSFLDDARTLVAGKRYDGAVYLCGYAVELGLKARICRTLKWSGFPETAKEFDGLQSFKTHDLERLLTFTGRQDFVRTKLLFEWAAVARWNPELRYKTSGHATSADTRQMIEAAERLLRLL